MSLLQRFVDTALTRVNTQRMPTGMAVNSFTGLLQPTGQVAQLNSMTAVGWLFAVVNRLAQSIAAQEWKLYRVQGGDKDEIDQHPAIDLWHSANPFVTRQDFLETSQQHMELVGEMWWVLVRNGAGVPVELQVVRPDRMRPIPHPTEFIAGYEYRLGSQVIPLEKDDVIFTRNPNPTDAYRGIGVVQSMMVDIGAERLAAEWMHNFFRNSAEPGGIIEFPGNLQDVDFQRLVERWRYQHQGVANAHRVAILEKGTWKDRKLTQRDMQFAELRKFERDQILGAFGMPLPIMGITESVNRANAEAAEVMYARWLIRPRLLRIRAALNEKLLKLYPDGDNLMFDFVDPVPENRVEMINEGVIGYEKKVLTLNEARRRFGEDDWAGPEGEERNQPMPLPMMAPPAFEEPEEDEEEEDEEEEIAAGYKPPRRPRGDWDKPRKPRKEVQPNDEYPDEANRGANTIEAGWKRRFSNEISMLMAFFSEGEKSPEDLQVFRSAGLSDYQTKINLDDVELYDWNWWAKYGDEVIEELASAFLAVLASQLPNMSQTELQRRASLYAEARGASLLKVDGELNLVNQTKDTVNTLVAETIEKGESLHTLETKIKRSGVVSPERARAIARTETATALGQGQKEIAKVEGRTQKRWITQADEHVSQEICARNAMEGWIPIGNKFQSSHSSGGWDTIPGHVNCRCVVQYRNAPATDDDDGKSFMPEVRCPQCNRKAGENIAMGTHMRCRRCKHEWEIS